MQVMIGFCVQFYYSNFRPQFKAHTGGADQLYCNLDATINCKQCGTKSSGSVVIQMELGNYFVSAARLYRGTRSSTVIIVRYRCRVWRAGTSAILGRDQ